MSRRIICDGCDRQLTADEVALHGQTGPGRPVVAPMPIRDFHLCAGCAVVGFTAMRRPRPDSTDLTRDV